jgi:mannose-6-phosphate isomerase-like protein (cupin superfamily)
MSSTTVWTALAAALMLPAAVVAQRATPPPAEAIDIKAADVQAVLKHTGPTGIGADRQIKVADMGKYNVGVGVLHRAATKPGEPVTAIAHAQVTEVYYIISGGGTLITGGTIANPRPFPDGEIVQVAVGPSTLGTFQGGTRRVVGVGDVVIIPPGVPHGFTDIKDHVTYLSVRPDADHILPAGYVHPAVAK